MRPGISYTSQGTPYMKNPGTFAFSQAQPRTGDKQQGPLAEPLKQNNQAAQRQFGSAQASGDYSAYSPSGDYSAYGPRYGSVYGSAQQNPQQPTQSRPQYSGMYWSGQQNQQQPTQGGQQYGGMSAGWPAGYTGPGSSPVVQMPRALPPPPPDSNGDGIPDVGGIPVSVQQPGNVQRQIDDMKRRGTWDDPRNAKVRERLTQELRDMQEAPPGYYKTPDGRFEPNYIHGIPGLISNAPPPQPDYGYGRAPAQPQPAPVYAPPQSQQYAPQQYVFPLQGQGPQFYNQRDAFIHNINTSLGQQMMQNFGGATPVAPQLNIPQLWAQAGQMAADGWTNPLAALIGNV